MKSAMRHAKAILAVSLVLHPTIYSIASAQTSTHMSDQGALADDTMFKGDPAGLYTSSPTDVTIGGSTIAIPDLYYGVNEATPVTNALPSISRQEDLYIHRDNEIGEMATSTGNFSSSGAVKAEETALDVLDFHTSGLPDLSSSAFLDPSRTLLSDTEALRKDFADCAVSYGFSNQTVSYDASSIQTCEKLDLDLTPMNAQRNYLGPSDTFTTSYSNGQHYCHRGVETTAVSHPSLCPLFNIMTSIPSNVEGWSNCTNGDTGCIELRLRRANSAPYPNGKMGWLFSNYSSWSQFCNSFNVITHQWHRASLCSASTPFGSNSTVNFNMNQGGWRSFTGTESWKYVLAFAIPQKVHPPSRPYNGYTKYPEQIIDGFGVIGLGNPGPGTYLGRALRVNINEFNAAIKWHRDGPWAVGGQYQVNFAFRPGADITAASGWLSHSHGSIVHNGVFRSNQTSWTDIPEIAADGVTNHSIRIDSTNLDVPVDARIRMYFDNKLFSDWLYNAARYAELLEIDSLPGCVVEGQTNSTADVDSDGCVARLAGNAGSTSGFACGTEVPLGLQFISDRASTDITLTPRCDVDLGNGFSYSTLDTCSPLEANPQCSLDTSDCLDSLPISGTCYLHSRAYSCGQPQSYQTTMATQQTVCSGLSCLGEDCVLDVSSNASQDLAEAAARLSSLEMILSDLDCQALANPPSDPAQADLAMQNCRLFKGEPQKCKKIVLGLANCCKEASGVSIVDYLQLAFATSRLNASMGALGVTTPITSAWVSFTDMTRNSFSKLTQPLTQTWESIVGNTGIAQSGASTFGIEAAKQAIMKSAAQWTADTFGVQAANTLFSATAGGPAIASSGTVVPGAVGFSAGITTVLSAVSAAYTAYMVVVVLSSILFACSKQEQELMVKRALRSTHYVGQYCSSRFLGACTSKRDSFCSYASPLSRILNQQIKAQLGRDFGTPENPKCEGISISEFLTVNMEAVDLSEWTGMMMSAGFIDTKKFMDIEELTGASSTLGVAQSDLYTRENAIDRNTQRLANADFAALRADARADMSATPPPPVDTGLGYGGGTGGPTTSSSSALETHVLSEAGWDAGFVATNAGLNAYGFPAGYSSLSIDGYLMATTSSPSLVAFQINNSGDIVNEQLAAKNPANGGTGSIAVDPLLATYFLVINGGNANSDVVSGNWQIDEVTRAVTRDGQSIAQELVVFTHNPSWNPNGNELSIVIPTSAPNVLLFASEDVNGQFDAMQGGGLMYNDGADVVWRVTGIP